MKFRHGMTLAETLLVFIIIGTIATITVSSVRPWEKPFKRTYMSMHSAMTNMLYNHMINTNKFPENTKELCKVFVTWFNTADHVKASDADTYCTDKINDTNNPLDIYSFPRDNPEVFMNERAKGGKGAINFSNGTRIWLGGCESGGPFEIKVGPNTGDENDENKITTKFFIVYLDLNGESGPNEPVEGCAANDTSCKKKMKDIVAFAFTDKYVVVPLGWPTVDIRYLQANYIIPSNSEDEDTDFVSEPMTFMEAKINAFGRYNMEGKKQIISGNDPMTFNLNYYYCLNEGNESQCHWFQHVGKVINPDSFFLFNSRYEKIQQMTGINIGNINPNCEPTEDSTEPVCNVKIFEYH